MKTRPFVSTTVFAFLGRLGGALIPFFIAAVYGATRETDAFFFAYGLLFALIAVFTHIFEGALVPFLAERKQDRTAVFSLTNSVFLQTVIPVTAICLAIAAGLQPALNRWSGWDESASTLVTRLFLEMLPVLIFAFLISAANSIFFISKIFWFPALSPLLRSLVVIGFIFSVHSWFEIHAVSWGFAAGECLRAMLVICALWFWTGWKPVIRSRENAEARSFYSHTFLQAAAILAHNLMFISDQWFAATLSPGSLSLLNYADRLVQIPYLLFVAGFLQVFLTDWSENYYQESITFWPNVRRDIKRAFYFVLALGAALWLGRHALVGLVYGRESFSADQLHLLSELFGWVALGLIPGMMTLLFGRIFFVMKKSGLYCFQACIQLALNIILDIILMRFYGIVGIAAATALVYTVMAIGLYFYLRRHAALSEKGTST